MIKKLKIKIICVLMAIFVAVLAGILIFVNYGSYSSYKRQSKNVLRDIAESDWRMIPGEPMKFSKDEYERIFNSMKVFIVKVDRNGRIIEANGNEDYSLSEAELEENVIQIINDGKKDGTVGSIRYYVAEKPYGKKIVYTEEFAMKAIFGRMQIQSLIAALCILPVLFIISHLIAAWMAKPVEEVFEKQKLFISDTSHELKTPISVIQANAEVLSSEYGESQWLRYIETETDRMNKLVNSLLTLARIENSEVKKEFVKFDLSHAVTNAALPFESVAFETGKSFEMDIKENIKYTGDEEDIKKLISILLDNAFKYTPEGEQIKISLNACGIKKIIEVYNTGVGIDEEDMPKIFERFYRVDKSRNREKESYGLGLSIAKNIVDSHNGKINVSSKKDEFTKFTVTL